MKQQGTRSLSDSPSLCQVVSADDKIVSIDLGWENSAYICLTPELEVEDWRRVNLGAHQFYSPEDRYDQVNKYLTVATHPSPFMLPITFCLLPPGSKISG